MSEKEKRIKKETSGKMSRREFLKDAGLIVGGATVGSMALVNACGGASTTTVTSPGGTTTKTVTSTVPGGTVTTTVGAGSTVTVTQPGATVTKEVQTGGGMPEGVVALTVNGATHYVEVEPWWSLAFVLREKLGLFGLKVGCDRHECGSCTIIVDGKAVYSCAMLAVEAEGKDILTIEGLAPDGNTLHPVQKSFMENGSFQCGYCTPGHIMSAVALMMKTPKPTLDQAREAISGNLCFCSDYTRITDAIMKAGG